MSTIIRYNKYFIIPTVLMGIISILGGYFFAAIGEYLISMLFIPLVIVSILGMIEIYRSRIELSDEPTNIQSLSEHHMYRRGSIEKVTWEKGCGVSIMYEGKWVSPHSRKKQPVLSKYSASLGEKACLTFRSRPFRAMPFTGRLLRCRPLA
jgi:hypothetical protein